MKTAFIALIGVLLFVASLFIKTNISQGESKALALDEKKTAFAEVGGDVLPPCSWSAQSPDRVMAENKSQAVVIQVKNPQKEKCESAVSLRAPEFDMSPVKEEQKINLSGNSKGALSWIITPHNTGTYKISLSDVTDTRIFGITVTNVFGFSAIQAKIASIFGTIFGPMLTLPWWWDRLRNRKPNPAVTNPDIKTG